MSARLIDTKAMVPEELTQYSETVRFNGTLDWPSIYRGTWEEVDDAWIDIVNSKSCMRSSLSVQD